MSTELLTRPVETDTGDHDRLTHIVYGDNPRALILQAMFDGTPVTALCGKVWVPSRDPERFPLCPECEEIRDRALGRIGDKP